MKEGQRSGIRRARPTSTATPAYRAAAVRQGFALVAALLAVMLIAALMATVFLAANEETRISAVAAAKQHRVPAARIFIVGRRGRILAQRFLLQRFLVEPCRARHFQCLL